MGRFFGMLCAVVLHTGFLLFGGLLFGRDKDDAGTLQEVELLSEEEAAKEEEKPSETTAEQTDEMEADNEEPPDAAEIIRSLELSSTADEPMLEAASLSAIEQALNGQGGASDFGDALSFASGGRIGAKGKAGALDEKLEEAFSLGEIDQKPRAIFQTSPLYPAEMRGKKVEGVVSVIFVVESSGKITNPRVEKSTHPAFERPALDAVKQWKFEPAIKGGERVSCKMRVSVRFPQS